MVLNFQCLHYIIVTVIQKTSSPRGRRTGQFSTLAYCPSFAPQTSVTFLKGGSAPPPHMEFSTLPPIKLSHSQWGLFCHEPDLFLLILSHPNALSLTNCWQMELDQTLANVCREDSFYQGCTSIKIQPDIDKLNFHVAVIKYYFCCC